MPFEEDLHPRGFHGRWGHGTGTKKYSAKNVTSGGAIKGTSPVAARSADFWKFGPKEKIVAKAAKEAAPNRPGPDVWASRASLFGTDYRDSVAHNDAAAAWLEPTKANGGVPDGVKSMDAKLQHYYTSAEAYRQAAAAVGLPQKEFQAIIWGHIRPNSFEDA